MNSEKEQTFTKSEPIRSYACCWDLNTLDRGYCRVLEALRHYPRFCISKLGRKGFHDSSLCQTARKKT